MRESKEIYMEQVRLLFPFQDKESKKYLLGFEKTLDELSEHESEPTLEMLYRIYGKPEEVIRAYCSQLDIGELERRAEKYKCIRNLRVVVIALILAVAIISTIQIKKYIEGYQDTLNAVDGYWTEVIEDV